MKETMFDKSRWKGIVIMFGVAWRAGIEERAIEDIKNHNRGGKMTIGEGKSRNEQTPPTTVY